MAARVVLCSRKRGASSHKQAMDLAQKSFYPMHNKPGPKETQKNFEPKKSNNIPTLLLGDEVFCSLVEKATISSVFCIMNEPSSSILLELVRSSVPIWILWVPHRHSRCTQSQLTPGKNHPNPNGQFHDLPLLSGDSPITIINGLPQTHNVI
ncbi:hypothetical protein Droror1_Dr00001410 [Drosera rotundifolia]